MKHAYFIAGTDTEIGKTHAACVLLHAFRARGFSTVAMKPVAAGVNAHGINEDVAALRAAASVDAPLSLVNPWCFSDPVAPHIAAREAGLRMRPEVAVEAMTALGHLADVVIVEGVGGFVVPLDDEGKFDAADLAGALGLPIILVVGMRLGCLNHALLTCEAIERRGLPLAGWIANRVDPNMMRFEENLQTLRSRIAAPCLGVIPHGASGPEAAAMLLLPTD